MKSVSHYTAIYTGGDVCTTLNRVFNLGLDKKYKIFRMQKEKKLQH